MGLIQAGAITTVIVTRLTMVTEIQAIHGDRQGPSVKKQGETWPQS